jgi:hypothetical protein
VKSVLLFNIENYVTDYSPVLEYMINPLFLTPRCLHYTSGKDPIEHASVNYPFANLPTRNSCSSSARLAQVSMNKIWSCPESSSQPSCGYYTADVHEVFVSSLFDAVGSEIVYSLIKIRNKHGYTYLIYNKTKKIITQTYIFEYAHDLIDDKAIEIFKQHLKESYDSVSSFIPDYVFTPIETTNLVSQNQKENSFLLSLVSTE